MKKIAAALLATAGAALAAPAFAETVTYYLWDPVTNTYVERTLERPATPPSATYTYPAPSATYVEPQVTYVEPRVTYTEPQVTYVDPPVTYVGQEIVVTAPRQSTDSLITGDVVDRIASNPRISGTIGVETQNRTVNLTGRTVTRGQADRAEQEARSVDGVRDVNNAIRARVGG